MFKIKYKALFIHLSKQQKNTIHKIIIIYLFIINELYFKDIFAK